MDKKSTDKLPKISGRKKDISFDTVQTDTNDDNVNKRKRTISRRKNEEDCQDAIDPISEELLSANGRMRQKSANKISRTSHTLNSECGGVLEAKPNDFGVVTRKGKPNNLETVHINSNKEYLKKSEEACGKNICLTPSVILEPMSFSSDLMKRYQLEINDSKSEFVNKKSGDCASLYSNKTTNNSKLSNTKIKLAQKRKFYGLLPSSEVLNLKTKLVRKKNAKLRNVGAGVYVQLPNSSESDMNTNVSEKSSEIWNSLSSNVNSFPPKVSLLNSFSAPELTNSNTSPKLSKVLIHKHIPAKPLNISINVDNKNLGRKVEFVKSVNDGATTCFIQSSLKCATSDENLSDTRCLSDIISDTTCLSDSTTALPVLHYYYGGWLYDCSEEDLLITTSRDFLFSNSKLPCSIPSESHIKVHEENSESAGDCGSQSSSQGTSSTKSNFKFIKPILPPAKRPPTRIKTTPCSTPTTLIDTSVDSVSLTEKTSTSSKVSFNVPSTSIDDDVISIYSKWSIKTSDFASTESSAEIKTESKVEKKEEAPKDESSHLPEASQYKDIAQWVENTQHQLQHERRNYVDFSLIPKVFKGFCYFAFTNGVCYKRVCSRVHILGRNHKIYLQHLNLVQLKEAYEFAKVRVALFVPLINNFIVEFAKFNCSKELVTMVKDVMIMENGRKFLDVQSIISSLQKIGYTFTKCIEEILMAHGGTNLELSDILLSTVIEEVRDLNSNWSLVQKLCQYRNSCPIDPALTENLLNKCCEQSNVDLCIKVVRDIFKRNLVDLNALNENIFTYFVSVLQYYNLIEEVNVLTELARLSNFTFNFRTSNLRSSEQPAPLSSFHTNYNYTPCSFENPNHTNNAESAGTMRFSPPSLIEGFNGNVADTPTVENTQNSINGDLQYFDISFCEASSSSDDATVSIDEDDGVEQVRNNDTVVNVEPPRNSPTSRECDRLETSLPDDEIKKLSEIISQQQHEHLIAMYNTYKNTLYNNAFVLNVIGLFKKKDVTSVYELVLKLIEGLEQQNSHFVYLANAESTLYTLVLHSIVLLKQMRGSKEAATLLFKFFNCLDNLTKVQWLGSMHKHALSEIGKYLYFCQVFTRGGYFNAALDILKSSELNLLHSFNKWTLPYVESFDNEYRNDVVQEFICTTLREEITLAKDIILHMINSKDSITEVNIWKYFDNLILALLNNNITEQITQLLPNILQGWYKYLTNNNMRGLLVQLITTKISEKQLITLYSKCCKRNIYTNLKGNETSIILRTDMTSEEIFITIRYFIYKLEKQNFQIQEVTLVVKMPEQLHNQPKILLNSECGLTQTRDRVLIVLTRCFPTAIIVQNYNEYNLVVQPDQLKLCVEHYRKWKNEAKYIWVRQSAVEQLGTI